MPTAEPTMPFSLSGVSITRCSPNSSCSPAVTRNTPPTLPTSSPSTTTRLSRRISTRSASLMACTMFICGIVFSPSVPVSLCARRAPQRRALLDQMPGELGVDVVEKRVDARLRGLLGGGDRSTDLRIDLALDLLLLGIGEACGVLEVAARARDGIEQPPWLEPCLGPVRFRVVARRVAGHPVRHRLDEC